MMTDSYMEGSAMSTLIVLLLCLVAGGGIHLYQLLILLGWIDRRSRYDAVSRSWARQLSHVEQASPGQVPPRPLSAMDEPTPRPLQEAG
jgi:hypothetical protein